MNLDLTETKLIDFEYTAFSCESWDLANHFNEIMFDNCYAVSPYVKLYTENCPALQEVQDACKFYLSLKKADFPDLDIETELDGFVRNVVRCMILNNIYWGVWGVLMIKPEEINDDIFNFGFTQGRLELNRFLQDHDEFKKYLD